MATPIIDHNLLTLDYWQDSVTYEGKTVPGGTIACEALNIPDALREKLESLLAVYQQLLEVTTGERQAIFEEMSQINQAKNASKVYHLFG